MKIRVQPILKTLLPILLAVTVGLWALGQPVVNRPPRTLTAENATEGLFPGMNHLFTIPDYWDYGDFEPQHCAELPGNLFRAKAQEIDCQEVFLIGGLEKGPPMQQPYSLERGRLYAAWRVKAPQQAAQKGKY